MYNISKEEKNCRKDIILLLDLLIKFSNVENRQDPNNEKQLNEEVNFPVHAYLNVIQYYLSYGYYKVNEVDYKLRNSGKIDWNRTIKKTKPLFSDNQAIFLKQMRKKLTCNENALITLINKYCVYDAFEKIGFIFTNYIPEKCNIKLNCSYFIQIIQKYKNETFNEKYIQLFNSMITMLLYLDKKKDNNYKIGANQFDKVWEYLIDEVYGLDNIEKYKPTGYWKFENEKPYFPKDMEPDTIMKNSDKLYILDAKYYKYAFTKQKSSLPTLSSIHKQIEYGEFAEEQGLADKDKIYNAFIMPYSSVKSGEHIKKLDAYATATWKIDPEITDLTKRKYYKIQPIMLDINYLLRHHDYSIEEIKTLAKLIDSGFEDI